MSQAIDDLLIQDFSGYQEKTYYWPTLDSTQGLYSGWDYVEYDSYSGGGDGFPYIEQQVSINGQYAINAYQVNEVGLDGQYSVSVYFSNQVEINGQYAVNAYIPQQVALNGQFAISAYHEQQVVINGQYAAFAYVPQQVALNGQYAVSAYNTAQVSINGQYSVSAYWTQQVALNGQYAAFAYLPQQVALNGQYAISAYQVQQVSLNGQYSISAYWTQQVGLDGQYAVSAYQEYLTELNGQYAVEAYVGQQVALNGQYAVAAYAIFDGWVMNLDSYGVWKYANYNFKSLSGTHGADGTGIYSLSGSTDDGIAISAYTQTGKLDLGSETLDGHLLKRMPDYYLGKDGGAMDLTVTTENSTVTYHFDAGTQFENAKENLARGAKGRYWQMKLANVNGSSATIDDQFANVVVIPRRV